MIVVSISRDFFLNIPAEPIGCKVRISKSGKLTASKHGRGEWIATILAQTESAISVSLRNGGSLLIPYVKAKG